ncbi:DNA-methyltransferase [Brevundimonas sp.]|uniref:DNA-methyltransferase n=1 Tax=Brevundimonas sp. TaxID=1871086 RepID=UPI002FCCAFB6
MSAIEDETVDFIMTSPPYWNLKDYGDSVHEIGDSSYEEYLSDLLTVWLECYRVAKPGAVMIINVNSRRSKGEFYPIDFDIVKTMQSWRFWDHNIWYIPNALPQPNHYMERLLDNKFESLLVFVKGDSKSYKFHKPRVPQKYAQADPRTEKKNARGRCVGNIVRVPAYRPPNIKSMGYHVAAYPEELVSFFIESYTDPNDLVLDPFTGSGTTLKVAQAMDRRGVGYEVHAEFAPLIRARIEEVWAPPPWTDVDIIHSSTMKTGSAKPRKSHFKDSERAMLPFDE